MPLYNISEFLSLIKEDIGIKDIPLPVDDKSLLQRFYNSALKEFSVRYPRIETIILGDENRIAPEYRDRNTKIIYRIPKYVYQDSTILAVTKFDVSRPLGYSDFYVPQGVWASPDAVLSSLADIKLAAALASTMGKAPTYQFKAPDLLYVYNGWSGGVYDVDVALMHDISLSTIPPTAITHLKQLAILDIEEYLYNKLKRIDNLDTGIGNIQLNINNWEDAGNRKLELLKEWDEDGNLDIDQITYF